MIIISYKQHIMISK